MQGRCRHGRLTTAVIGSLVSRLVMGTLELPSRRRRSEAEAGMRRVVMERDGARPLRSAPPAREATDVGRVIEAAAKIDDMVREVRAECAAVRARAESMRVFSARARARWPKTR